MLTEDMDDLLRSYFLWSKSGDPSDIGYQHINVLGRLMGGSIGAAGLSDEEALHVNRAMGYLKHEDPDAYRVLVKVYKERKSLRWLERRGHGDRKVLAIHASRGRQFLRGALFAVFAS